MTNYLITGATGFLGRNVVPRLLARDPSAEIAALVRPDSVDRLTDLAAGWRGGDRVRPLVGDLAEPDLGLDTDPEADVVVHLGAVYDMTAGDEQAQTNVDGTRAVVALATRLGATVHHVSSIAVAGDHTGPFDETDFYLGQGFPSPYHRTKFEAERLVREASGLRWRVYRPAVVVGDSRTGEINKADGPYYFFPALAALARLPHALPVLVPDLGATNIVPVDYVADALVELVLAPGLDGRTFHLANPTPQPLSEIYAALADAAGAPRLLAAVPAGPLSDLLRIDLPGRDAVLRRLGVPPAVVDTATLPTVFGTAATQRALSPAGIRPPQFHEYASALWQYWRDHLDPDRARRADPRGPLVNRHVVITGASSGIGRAAAFALAARGARVILIARRADELAQVVAQIRAEGGSAFAYPCDLTEEESVEHTVKTILAEHCHVDMLVNNAGRSIRRSVYRSVDRMHDFERTMAVNYFGAVRLTLALLPQMRERRFGHIVNVSTAGVQVATPRFSAYVASKAALDKFAEVVATETLADGIGFTTIHLPLVETEMIAPSGGQQPQPAASPEWAAATIVRALVERPKRIDVPVGTLAEYAGLFTPGLKDRALHRYHRAYPDSPAARGESDAPGPAPHPPVASGAPALDSRPALARPSCRSMGSRCLLVSRGCPGCSN